MKNLLRVLHYMRPYWKLAAASVILTGAAAGMALLLPWPLKIVVDNVLQAQPLPPLLARFLSGLAASRFGLLLFAVCAGLLVTLVEQVLMVLNEYTQTRLNLNMILNFRSDMFQHAQRLSLAFHDNKRSGMLIYCINSMADAAPRVVMAVLPIAQSTLTLIGMFWVSYKIDRQLALLSLTVVPVLFYAVRYYTKYIQSRLLQVKQMEGESLAIIHEAISMLRVIIAFGREAYEHQRFRAQGERTVDARVRLTVKQQLFSLIVQTTTAAGTALVLGFGAYHVIEGQLSVGQLLVVLAYIAAVYTPLETISRAIGSLQDLLISLRMAFDVMDIEPDITDAPDAVSIDRARGRLAFEGVNFSYASRVDTLRNISFEVEAGQVIAVVGPTGAGKTTLISLIPRFYDANAGRILLDGMDTRQLALKSLRAQVSMVLQEPLLFSGSIADNIRYGRLEATMAEIIEAARAANAHDFIMALPKQYDTELGERGAKLSGGERQRIAVARAFLRDAPILILDEPTSAIDSKTEGVILDALDRLMVGRTTFMVAHRLSTIRNADLILVMNRGEIVERGTHDELLQQQGLYRQLYDVQTGQVRRRMQSALRPYAASAD